MSNRDAQILTPAPEPGLHERLAASFVEQLADHLGELDEEDRESAYRDADAIVLVIREWLVSSEVYTLLTERMRLPQGLDCGYIASRAMTVLAEHLTSGSPS